MRHQRAIVEPDAMSQTGTKSGTRKAGEKRIMTNFLQKVRAHNVVASIAEYAVMLFVAAMTGLSTLRLLGMLP
jgi:hypothetical protein